MTNSVHQKNIDYLSQAITVGKFDDFMLSKEAKLSHFSSGGGNHLYLIESSGKKYLARVNYYHLKNEWKIKRHEFEVLSLVEELNIAPHPYYLSDSESELDQHFIVIEYIEGDVPDELTEETVVGLASILKKLHQFQTYSHTGNRLPPTDPLPYSCSVYEEFAQGDDKQIERYRELESIEQVVDSYNRVKERLGYWFNALSIFKDCKHFVLCHADLKMVNILVGPSGVHLIDWEGAGVDIPETDIGRLFSGASLTPEQEAQFLGRYYESEPTALQREQIQSIRKVLDFFRIIEDYILLKRKPWNAQSMLEEISIFESTLH